MHTSTSSKKVLVAAVLCSLFTASTVWAAQQTTETVTPTNNKSSETDPYDSIKVSGTDYTKTYGINTDGASSAMIVFVTGNDNLNVTVNSTTNYAYAYGINNTSNALTIKGRLYGTVTATSSNDDKSTKSGEDVSTNNDVSAYGLVSDGPKLTTENIGNITVTATSGDALSGTPTGSNSSANANVTATASGIYNRGSIETGNIDNLTVTATSGKATGGNYAGSSDSYTSAHSYPSYVYGLENVGNASLTTLHIGNLNVTAISNNATGGSSSSTSYADTSTETNTYNIYGLYNDDRACTMSTVNIDNINITVKSGDATSGNISSTPDTASATAMTYVQSVDGIHNADSSTMTTGNISSINITATAGKATASDISVKSYGDANALAYVSVHGLNGLYVDSNRTSMTIGDIGSLTINATAGDATAGNVSIASTRTADCSARSYAEVAGINNNGPMTIKDIGSINITATAANATAGTIKSTADHSGCDAYANAYANADGIYNNGTLNIDNIKGLKVTATAGKAVSGSANISDGVSFPVNNYATAAGVYNSYNYDSDTGTVTIGDLLGVDVTAKGGNTILKSSKASANASTLAYGVYSEGKTVNINGDVEIKNVSVTPGTITDVNGTSTPAVARAYSLFVTVMDYNPATINVGVDTASGYPTSNKKTVKLVGDVAAVNGGTNNIILYGSDSYLQGNILSKTVVIDEQGNVSTSDEGTNNITITNGATWKPVYDNRYGSFVKAGDTSTYNLSNTVTEVSTPNLNLTDGGIVDLTWDNATRDPATSARTLTITKLSGDGGIYKINSNLAQNKADQIVLGADSTSTSVGIDVAYDPILATSGLTTSSDISGKALVLTDNSKKLTSVKGVADSFNLYDYTPVITDNGDNTYSLTQLVITNVASLYNKGETFTPTFINGTATIGDKIILNGGAVDTSADNATRDPATEQRTLTLDNVSGTEGLFKIHTNLAANTGDQIFLGADSTLTKAAIDVTYDPFLAASGLKVGDTISGKALALIDTACKLTEVTGVADSYNTYDYVPTITDTGESTWSVTKLTITNAGGKNKIISPSTAMREALHQRMAMHNLWVNGELNNMEKRMGDLRAAEPAEAGIWARYEHNKLEKGSDASLKYNYFQLGFDKDFKGTTGTFYRGGAFSYAKGTGEYEVGNGDLKEGALTLYQTWVGKNGNYYDIVAKTGKLMNNYDAINTANKYSADYHSWAYSISGEVGKRIRYANGLYVEPQAEFTLGRINGADYTTSTGMDVSVDKQSIALARLGVAVGKEIKNVGGYYAKASYYHDFGGGLNLTASDSNTNPFSYGEDSAKNWCVFTLGGDVKAGKNCNIYGELSKFTGELSNKVQVNIGARWSF
jgi:outer membrane autotransporter protein